MQRLYFIRHGQSELGARGLYAGRTETPLTKMGQEQARKAGQAARNLHIDLIVSSPMERTLQTAEIIAGELGYTRTDIRTHPLLVERNFGKLEAQPYKPGRKDYSIISGAETDEDVVKRARQVLDWLRAQPGENLLVVGHGAIGRAIRSLLVPDYPMTRRDPLQNAQIYQLL